MTERRTHPRFRLVHATARTDGFEATVLDLSRSGMRIESAGQLAVGEAMQFEVGDCNHSLDVAGRVQWSRRSRGADDSHVYRSGVRFVRVLTGDAQGAWARLVAECSDTGLPARRGPETAHGHTGLLTILSPEDGTVTPHGAVNVIGKVRDPGLGAMIEVNGIRALVYGRRFEARIPLLEGANLVSATVSTSLAPVYRSNPVRITRSTLPS